MLSLKAVSNHLNRASDSPSDLNYVSSATYFCNSWLTHLSKRSYLVDTYRMTSGYSVSHNKQYSSRADFCLLDFSNQQHRSTQRSSVPHFVILVNAEDAFTASL